MRHTVRGLIIEDRKILLVTGYDADFFWTPGGGIEEREVPEQALRREIQEELGVKIETLKPYSSYDYEDQRVENFIIEIEGKVRPNNEITKVAWYSSKSNIRPSEGFRNIVLPRLLKENLID